MVRFRDGLIRVGLVASLLLPVYFLIAALGTKFHLLEWRFGFGVLVLAGGALLLLIVFVLALLGLILAFVVKPRRGWRSALVALIVPVLGLGFAGSVIASARSIPPIHDISTDIQDPPTFSPAVVAARAAITGGNAVVPLTTPGPGGRSVGEIGRTANPDLTTLSVAMAVPQATQAAATAARSLGWRDVVVDPATGRVEAVVESFWFGFRDDIVVRIRPGATPTSSVIDVRSTSRVGMGDLGANAKRVRAFLAAMRAAH